MAQNKAKAMGLSNAIRQWKDGEIVANGNDGDNGTNTIPKIFCKGCNSYEAFDKVATIHKNREGKQMAGFTCKKCNNKWYAIDREGFRNIMRGNITLGDLVVGNVGITLKIKGKTPDFAKSLLKDMGLYSPIKKVTKPTFDGVTPYLARCSCGRDFTLTYEVETFRCPDCYGCKVEFIEVNA